jgi:pimeloyl-ACP methyl ester carboxylesterase
MFSALDEFESVRWPLEGRSRDDTNDPAHCLFIVSRRCLCAAPAKGKTMNDPASTSLGPFKSEDLRARYMAAYDAVLRKWPVAYEELYVPTGLGVTHVIVSGPVTAPPLLLLSCMQGTATVWRPNVEGLSRHFRLYAVDVIGQAGKSVAIRKIKNRRDYAGWLGDLLDGLGVARTSVVGNSYGGFLAVSLALLAPARVDRVVLISPAGVFASVVGTFLYGALRAGVAYLAGNRRAPEIAAFLGRDVHLDPRDADWAHLVSLALSSGVRMNLAFPSVFSKAELRAIRAPALLLIGDNELLYEPHATLRRARACMPTLEGEIVPNAHHIAAMARPGEINALIIQFLQRST